MLSALSEWLFDTSGLAPHGYCLLWEPSLIWLYAISDTATALSYFSIPLAIVVVGKRRSDLVFRPLLWLSAAFILLCGTTHWLDLVTLWTPLYGLQGLAKAATAVASVLTAIAVWWALPHFLNLPSIEQLQRANAALLASEERLAHAHKMEALGQLTGGIAHDFNNLLQVIVGSLAVIERQIALGSVSALERPIGAIRKASISASSLTNRMLAFSRRQTLLPQEINPDQLVRGMEEMLHRTLGPQIELDLRLGRGCQNVTCDASQLEGALLNLAVNARDAMPEGGRLSIAVTDREFADDVPDPDMTLGRYVAIEVEDTGVGISAAMLDRVFEPFFTTKPPGHGTGLGLSQTYGFVKQSGGSVRIESTLGQGTRVHIYLPAHERGKSEVLESSRRDQNVQNHRLTQTGRVLLVEDQDEIRFQIAETLKEMGCIVVEACDGAAGSAELKKDQPLDLLITDVGLPSVSGLQLADIARAERPDLPVLIITGYAGKSADPLQLAPTMRVLRKPFKLDELALHVRMMLRASVAEKVIKA